MSGVQWMVVAIVAIVMFTRFLMVAMRHEERKLSLRHEERKLKLTGGTEAVRVEEEVRALKERLAVLERIATDESAQSARLERQIEDLRDRA